MTSNSETWPDKQLNDGLGQAFEYLIVDLFLSDFLGAQVLAYALDCGLIDSLIQQSESYPDIDVLGKQFLYGILCRDGIVEEVGDGYRVTEDFKSALKFRDLLEAKLRFSSMLTPDIVEHLPKLLADPDEFFIESSLFSLFDYSRALEINSENLALTKQWVDLTTALTRYEGRALLQTLNFETAAHWLDVGGNSGEFALQLVQQYPGLEVSIVDLPVVCELGREHVGQLPGADRIRFIAGDALSETLPESNDVVSFKSMLHDWPEPAVEVLLDNAFDALKPGGQVLIFERARLDWQFTPATFGNLATQLFFRSYKTPDYYVGKLTASGFVDIQCRSLELETAFHVITAFRGPA